MIQVRPIPIHQDVIQTEVLPDAEKEVLSSIKEHSGESGVLHLKSQGIGIDGDQLSWDGKDTNGDYVSTGVYLLLIYGEDGSHKEEKIPVIKQ